MAEYADLEIRILEQGEEGYPVEITLNNEQEFPRGFLDPGKMQLPWVSSGSPVEDGRRLFDWLLADDQLKLAWAETRGQRPQRRLRLRLDATAPELHSIPWELLRDQVEGEAPQDLAAASATPFSRYLAGRRQPGGPVLKRPVRALVAIANPENLGESSLVPVDVDHEWRLLQEATTGLEIELTLLDQPCTLANIEAALKDGYHILHFIGHGAYNRRRNKAGLYLADDQNQVKLTMDEEFTEMLARQMAGDLDPEDRLRLIFLASCETATRSPADAFRGLAPQLVAAGVPAVLAMQEKVPVDTSRRFSTTFYRRLLGHGLVDLAANEARSSVLSADLPGAAIPVLFSRLRGGQLLGKRGRVSGARGEEFFWPFLMDNVQAGLVTAFLGPRVTEGLLPSRENLAQKLADHYSYPLRDKDSLTRVVQFVDSRKGITRAQLRDRYMNYLKRGLYSQLEITPSKEQIQAIGSSTLAEVADSLDWAERFRALHETEIHHQLADLQLPLYLTTNVDSFMVDALGDKGFSPRRIGLRWVQPGAGGSEYVLTPEPSRENPVVLHLNGYDGDPEQLERTILSEDDFLEHFVRLSRDQSLVLPMNIIEMFSEHSFLFLGFQLDDWEFRTILHGLVKEVARAQEGKLHVGVQLEEEENLGTEAAMDYLSDYMSTFSIDIYWGSTRQFVNEIHNRWGEYNQADYDPYA